MDSFHSQDKKLSIITLIKQAQMMSQHLLRFNLMSVERKKGLEVMKKSEKHRPAQIRHPHMEHQHIVCVCMCVCERSVLLI